MARICQNTMHLPRDLLSVRLRNDILTARFPIFYLPLISLQTQSNVRVNKCILLAPWNAFVKIQLHILGDLECSAEELCNNDNN